MQRLEVSGAVRPIYGSLGVKRLSKALPFGNSGTTWKTKQTWIRISFTDGAIMAEHLIKAQKNEKMPISVTVPTTLRFLLNVITTREFN